MKTQLITIAVFAMAFHANLVKGRLEADGIPCYIQDEYSVQTTPMLTNAIGGVKLQVKDEDVPMAVALLRHTGYRTVFDTPPVPEKKESHILLRFLKFILAAGAVLAWAYVYRPK